MFYFFRISAYYTIEFNFSMKLTMKKILYSALSFLLLAGACKKDKSDELSLRNRNLNDETLPKIEMQIVSHSTLLNYTPYNGVQKVIMAIPNSIIEVKLNLSDNNALEEYEVWIEEYNVKGAPLSNWQFRDRIKLSGQAIQSELELLVPENTAATLYTLNLKLRDLAGNETFATPIIIRVEQSEDYDIEPPIMRMQQYLSENILSTNNGFIDMSLFVADNKKLMAGKVIIDCFGGMDKVFPIHSKECHIPLSKKNNMDALLYLSSHQLQAGKYNMRLTFVDNVGNFVRSEHYRINVR